MENPAKKINREIDAVTTELLELLSTFPEEVVNTVPFEGSWTAAQVAEHIHRSDLLLIKTLYGPVKPTERAPDSAVETLKRQFLNFEVKLKSPAAIIPAERMYDKDVLIAALKESRARIQETVSNLDLTATCESPVLGSITRLEIAHFIVYHTQRHIHQLKNIYLHVATQ